MQVGWRDRRVALATVLRFVACSFGLLVRDGLLIRDEGGLVGGNLVLMIEWQ